MFREDSTSNQTDGYVRIARQGTVIIKRFAFVFSLLMVVAPSGVRAQKLENHGLVVTGSVHKVEAKCDSCNTQSEQPKTKPDVSDNLQFALGR